MIMSRIMIIMSMIIPMFFFSLRWTGLQCGDAHSEESGHSGLLMIIFLIMIMPMIMIMMFFLENGRDCSVEMPILKDVATMAF
jgi:hypothetical protein